ncbi:MAG: hypothetical protein EBE86_010225 [Hormoscilla sp. GUM202]|nr:hypothetical protein [Hormoscilla sp. GUM202]
MKIKTFSSLIAICLSCLLWLGIGSCSQSVATDIPAQETNYFSSWKGGEANPTVRTIMDFVAEVDAAGIDPSDRVTVFDNVIAQDIGGEGIWVLPVLHSYSGHRTGVNSPCTASECLTGQEQFLRSENFSNAYGVGGFDLEVVSRQPSARICS